VCGKDACARHRAACGHCGRNVCTADLEQPSRRCVTCRQLAVIADPPDDVLTAARAVTGGGPKSSRPWRMAATTVTWSWSSISVEAEDGLHAATRETVPDSVVKHTLLGSEQR